MGELHITVIRSKEDLAAFKAQAKRDMLARVLADVNESITRINTETNGHFHSIVAGICIKNYIVDDDHRIANELRISQHRDAVETLAHIIGPLLDAQKMVSALLQVDEDHH